MSRLSWLLPLGLALMGWSCGSGSGSGPVVPSPSPAADLPYEGYGSQTVGGRGGNTCHVTNFAGDYSAGSFSRCAVASSPQIVVFDVAGTITLDETVFITAPYLTIDGTMAPPPGITIRPRNSSKTALAIENTHDVIVKGIRLLGYGTEDGADLLRIDGDLGEVYNVIVDRVTAAAADDGAIDITGNARDITISWCFLYDNALASLVKYGTQRRISFHRNVFANNPERNPLLWGDLADLDYVNNIIYNWYHFGIMVRHQGDVGNDGRVHANIVNNLFVHEESPADNGLVYGTQPGPDADDGGPSATPAQGSLVTTSQMGTLWVSGNILPAQNRDQYSTVSSPLPVPNAARVTTWPASALRTQVLPIVGTRPRTIAEQQLLDRIAASRD